MKKNLLTIALLTAATSEVTAENVSCVDGLKDALGETDPAKKPTNANFVNCLLELQTALNKKPDDVSMTGIPKGAVLASTRPCIDLAPNGDWVPYFPAAGRFVIGAGLHSPAGSSGGFNLDANGQPLTTYSGPGDLADVTLRRPSAANSSGTIHVGGSETHKLEKPEMPKHNHAVGWSSSDALHTITLNNTRGDVAGDLQFRLTYQREGGQAGRFLMSDFQGQGRPHNNMPPFVALHFCKKDG